MAEENQEQIDNTPPLAVKKTASQRGFSPIWIIPIVAVVIGAFLAYRVISESGPTITISFKEATGLEAGKTKIKFKDVEVGEVTTVDLMPDLSGVTITASMSAHADDYLRDKTSFWVVRAQISAGNISGLSTLLSGDYIGMDPSTEGAGRRDFVGLERQPVIHSGEPGSYYNLVAQRLGGLNFGSPVYFRQIMVGSIVDYDPTESGDIKLEVFIKEPYDKHVNAATRFWNASGIDVTLSAEGLEINTESLVSIVSGGVAFDTIAGLGLDAGTAVDDDHKFTLYSSREAGRQKKFSERSKLLLYFEDSVRGLLPGAPVELQGYKIGEVVDVAFEFDRVSSSFKIPVLIEIQPQRVKITGELDYRLTFKHLVEKGLRAQLKTGNIVLGQKLVSLDFHPDAPPAHADLSGPIPILPTLRGSLGEITADATALIAELRQTGETLNTFLASPAFKASVEDVSATLVNIKQITAKVDKTTAPQISAVLVKAETTLQEASVMLAANSATRTEISRLLVEIAEAARSIRLLADYIEQHPESIIKGKD
jgi:paraquat-inducible protein B